MRDNDGSDVPFGPTYKRMSSGKANAHFFPLREFLVFYPMLNQFVLLSKDVVLSQIHR